MKVVLSLQHEAIPPLAHLQTLNPRIPWGDYRIAVPTRLTPWPRADRPRRAGVSAFGFSGTNVHVVLEEAPAAESAPAVAAERPLHALALSARSEPALLEAAARLARHLEATPRQHIQDVAYTLSAGRAALPFRAVALAADPGMARERLAALSQGSETPGLMRGRAGPEPPRVAFLFTGQGAQYAGMGQELYRTQAAFRGALDACAAVLDDHLDRPLLDVMFGAPGCEGLIDRTLYTQPCLFALEWSLAQLWRSCGVEPAAVLGHSVGEFAAASLAGVFSWEQGLRLIAERARLMDSLPGGGSMAAVEAPEARVRGALAGHERTLSIAALNGPNSVVISGASESLREATASLQEGGIRHQALSVSHAFHSPLMEPILERWERCAAGVAHSAPRIELVSNLTGQVATPGLLGPEYWRRHAREAVRYAEGVETLAKLGCSVFVEIGPAPVLCGLARRALNDDDAAWLASLRKGRNDWSQLLETMAALWVRGVAVDWGALDDGQRRHKLALPSYPFQRSRHWVATAAAPRSALPLEAPVHGLLGRRLDPPLEEARFEAEWGAGTLPFLGDHRFYGAVVAPATALIETALAAAATLGPTHGLASLEIERALVLPGSEPRTVQLVLTPAEDGGASFRILSSAGEADWTLHARGLLQPTLDGTPEPGELAVVRLRCGEALAVSEYYSRFEQAGVTLGPSFRGLQEIWRGDGEALARAVLPVDEAGFLAHPALLDAAAFQLLAAALPAADAAGSPYMPVAVGGVRLHGRLPTRVWSHVRVRREGADELSAQARVFDDRGRPLAEIDGLRLRRTSRDALERSTAAGAADLLYELAWRPTATPQPAAIVAGSSWLVLADAAGVGYALAAGLRERGARVHVASVGAVQGASGEAGVDPESAEQLAALVQQALQPGPLTGIVHLWALDTREDGVDPMVRQAASCGSALHLVQALATSGATPRLWLVTRGAQAAGGQGIPSACQAPLWGFGRTLALEQPELRATLVDLDPEGDATAALLAEVSADDAEGSVAWRNGQRLAGRLERRRAASLGPPQGTGRRSRLSQARPGSLADLRIEELPRLPPGSDEVEVRVEACGLNFRDVLNALGMYPGGALPLGNECAGRVVALGEHVDHLRVGDEVIALAAGALASYVTTRAHLVVGKPAGLSMEEAASLPTAFLTAAYGLEHLARVSRGERVLIHAAAGGVGLAALQLAVRAGAEVFATAGSPAKREYLRSLGVEHVFDSRSVAYADEIRGRTGGEGVDVVLNAFVGEHIPRGLSLLRAGGRFLEIGKREVWDAQRAKAAYPGVSYHAYDLAERFAADPELAGRMLRELAQAFGPAGLRPLPLRAFSFVDAALAFRYMAQARHIGKLVLRPPRPAEAPALRPDASYLVTGGLGGLGLKTAEWLVDKGARSLVLMGRHGASGPAATAVAALEAKGARVRVAAADVADRAALRGVLQDIDAHLPPLRGVLHCAGVLEDGIVAEQDWGRFARVMAPKVSGAWNLHSETAQRPIDLFVLFSSASALLGSPGQSNYAAANAYLDALAWRRRAEGLPALSVDWGPWAEVGMAAAQAGRDQSRRLARGIRPTSAMEGVRALESLLREDATQAAVMAVDWAMLLAAGPAPKLLSTLLESTRRARRSPGASSAAMMPNQPAAPPRDARVAILAAAPAERGRLIEAHLAEQVWRVMQVPAARVDSTQPLKEFGLDSLMAVEIRNRVQATLGVSLPLVSILEGQSVARLAATVGTLLDQDAAKAPAAAPAEGSAPEAEAVEASRLLQQLPDLSEEQVNELLRKMLEKDQA
jgi:acyl transferase domain-containing protein/NADPH:quinone reductase-like Zn-dependent oxidoreductase